MKKLVRLVAVGVAMQGGLFAGQTAPAGRFDCSLLPSVQYASADIFFHTPSDRMPQLAVADEIAPGQRLDLLVFALGYGVDAESRAHVTYTLAIHYPDGKTQNLAENVAIADHAKVDPRGLLFPARIVSFQVDPGSPSGEYRFEVIVRDQVGGGTVTKSAVVRASASTDPLPLPAGPAPERFVEDYYRRPQPRLALSSLTALSDTPAGQQKVGLDGALFGFYGQVLADNPWLLPQFKARLGSTTNPRERRLLALVLAYAQRRDPNFGTDLPRVARAALTAARRESLPLPAREPLTGGQLDLRWGQFFASGRFEPIAELVRIAAAYLPCRGKLGEFKQLSPRPKTVPLDVRKDIILGAAVWSLGSNAAQHPLVRDYLAGLGQAKDASRETKIAVQAALDWKPAPPRT